MSADVEAERRWIDAIGDVRQVPAHVEAISGREHALIKNLERRFEQRRAGPLQEHGSLLRKVRNQLAPTVDEGKLSERCRRGLPCRCAEQSHQANAACTCDKAPP